VSSLKSLVSEVERLRTSPGTDLELVSALNRLAGAEYRNSPENARRHAEEALILARKLNDDSSIASSLHMYGTTCWVKGDFEKALENYRSALIIWEKLGDKQGIAGTSNNIGNIYRDRGNYSEALDWYLQSLQIKISIGNRKGQAISFLNIGNIYRQQGLFEQAGENYAEALSLYEEFEDDLNIAKCYNNLGLVQAQMGNSQLALEEHRKALAIRQEIEDSYGLSNSYGNIGSILGELKQHTNAREYFTKALELKEKLLDSRGISISCSNIGSTFLKQKQYNMASEFFTRGLQVAADIGARDLEAICMYQFSELFEARENYKQALDYLKKYLKIKDNLFSEDSREKIAVLSVKFGTERKQMEADNFRQKNVELRKIMDQQKIAEIELEERRSELEKVVQERTAELMKVNRGLETEISERMTAEQALIDAENDLKASYDMLEKSFKGTICTISKIVEMRDPYYQGHHLRTADLARSIAVEMKLSEEQIQAIYFASIVYGIGKIKIPQEFLSRSGKLSEIELKVVRTYPQNGYDILKNIEFPWPIADIVLQHHEHIDGSGYPFGLKGNEIMQEAQILCVADTVEAMSSRRPYRPPFNLETTVEQLKQRSGVLYGSRSVEACLAVIEQGRFSPREDYAGTEQFRADR